MVLTRSKSLQLLKHKQSTCHQPIFKQQTKTNSKKFPKTPNKFPLKLWDIVESKEIQAVEWRKDGTAIGIDPVEFQYILRTNQLGFKTVILKAFLRQLNIYGFRKVNSETNYLEYEHPFFRKNKPILSKVLRNVSYKNELDQPQITSITSSQESGIEVKKENSIGEENLSEDPESTTPYTQDSETLTEKTPNLSQKKNLNSDFGEAKASSPKTVQIEASKAPESVYVHYNYYGKTRNGKLKETKSCWDATFAEDLPANAYFF
ncbi:heat shock factor protein-like [Tetranychus urticae]|uniref:HSF-type DNA-binding domain-containing protein n=1 Tax=Tetranychus urticae TaxID=32264 RepID=T1KH77_TETUR|nr:heat shock factor protein-like [Tetranychus urticae]